MLTDSVVIALYIRRERITATDAHLRARVAIIDGSWLEFSEYVERTRTGDIQVVVYSYHWVSETQELIRRWDNTPHFPDLQGFPHHIHDGPTGTILPGRPTSIFAILDYIAQSLDDSA